MAAMENPLKQLVPAEEREDGVYVKIDQPAGERVSFDRLIAALQKAMVVNYDEAALRKAWDRATGEFECIGAPFEYYAPELDKYIEVSVSPERATVTINSLCLSEGITLTPAHLRYRLQRKGVCFGINEEAVAKTVLSADFDKTVVVAEARKPVDGTDGTIKFEKEINPEAKPEVQEDGSVDYRNIQSFVQVAKGDVIARRIPPTPGTPGTTPTGTEIPATPGKEAPFPNGKNTIVSKDGRYLIAGTKGLLCDQNGLVCVEECLLIASDIDFSVGNVNFCGDIEIRGNVLAGFSIHAEGNILITGEVESAKVVSDKGTVTIEKGVIGKGEALISGKAGISASFAQEATLHTDGKIEVKSNLLHCNCLCDSLEVIQPQSHIIGGHIQAFTSIQATQVGNEQGLATKVSLADKNAVAAEKKLNDLQAAEKELAVKLEPLEKELKAKAELLKKAGGRIDDAQRDAIKKLTTTFNSLNAKMKMFHKMKEEANAVLAAAGSNSRAFIKITRDVYPGTTIDLFGVRVKLRERMTNKRFCLRDGKIHGG